MYDVKDCWDIVQVGWEYHLLGTSKAATGSTQNEMN